MNPIASLFLDDTRAARALRWILAAALVAVLGVLAGLDAWGLYVTGRPIDRVYQGVHWKNGDPSVSGGVMIHLEGTWRWPGSFQGDITVSFLDTPGEESPEPIVLTDCATMLYGYKSGATPGHPNTTRFANSWGIYVGDEFQQTVDQARGQKVANDIHRTQAAQSTIRGILFISDPAMSAVSLFLAEEPGAMVSSGDLELYTAPARSREQAIAMMEDLQYSWTTGSTFY